MTTHRTPLQRASIAALLAFVLFCCCAVARAGDVSWEFGGAQAAADAKWTVERGRIDWTQTPARMQPDKGGRLVLLSPAGLALTNAGIKAVAIDLVATGLQRVRIQGRRNAQGGWITIADSSVAAMRTAEKGVVVEKKARVPDGAIDQLRIEFSYRTTGARDLTRIAVLAP